MSGAVTPIVALDVGTTQEALRLVDELGDLCRFYKIGSELYTAEGPQVVRSVQERGASVFLDLKFHDIPNTVQGAVRSAVLLGVRLLTVHAAGGRQMLEAAVKGVRDAAETRASEIPAEAVSTGVWNRVVQTRVELFAVTVLTSMDAGALSATLGRSVADVQSEVLRLAQVAVDSGLNGIVCAGSEAAAVRAKFGNKLATLVPGVRLGGGQAHDQARVVTPREAAAAGARYIILGRAVTAAESPQKAMSEALADLP